MGTHTLYVRISAALWERLENVARDSGLSISRLTEQLLSRQLLMPQPQEKLDEIIQQRAKTAT